MKGLLLWLCIELLLLTLPNLNANTVKFIPGKRQIIHKNGTTHNISRFYAVPKAYSNYFKSKTRDKSKKKDADELLKILSKTFKNKLNYFPADSNHGETKSSIKHYIANNYQGPIFNRGIYSNKWIGKGRNGSGNFQSNVNNIEAIEKPHHKLQASYLNSFADGDNREYNYETKITADGLKIKPIAKTNHKSQIHYVYNFAYGDDKENNYNSKISDSNRSLKLFEKPQHESQIHYLYNFANRGNRAKNYDSKTITVNDNLKSIEKSNHKSQIHGIYNFAYGDDTVNDHDSKIFDAKDSIALIGKPNHETQMLYMYKFADGDNRENNHDSKTIDADGYLEPTEKTMHESQVPYIYNFKYGYDKQNDPNSKMIDADNNLWPIEKPNHESQAFHAYNFAYGYNNNNYKTKVTYNPGDINTFENQNYESQTSYTDNFNSAHNRNNLGTKKANNVVKNVIVTDDNVNKNDFNEPLIETDRTETSKLNKSHKVIPLFDAIHESKTYEASKNDFDNKVWNQNGISISEEDTEQQPEVYFELTSPMADIHVQTESIETDMTDQYKAGHLTRQQSLDNDMNIYIFQDKNSKSVGDETLDPFSVIEDLVERVKELKPVKYKNIDNGINENNSMEVEITRNYSSEIGNFMEGGETQNPAHIITLISKICDTANQNIKDFWKILSKYLGLTEGDTKPLNTQSIDLQRIKKLYQILTIFTQLKISSDLGFPIDHVIDNIVETIQPTKLGLDSNNIRNLTFGATTVDDTRNHKCQQCEKNIDDNFFNLVELSVNFKTDGATYPTPKQLPNDFNSNQTDVSLKGKQKSAAAVNKTLISGIETEPEVNSIPRAVSINANSSIVKLLEDDLSKESKGQTTKVDSVEYIASDLEIMKPAATKIPLPENGIFESVAYKNHSVIKPSTNITKSIAVSIDESSYAEQYIETSTSNNLEGNIDLIPESYVAVGINSKPSNILSKETNETEVLRSIVESQQVSNEDISIPISVINTYSDNNTNEETTAANDISLSQLHKSVEVSPVTQATLETTNIHIPEVISMPNISTRTPSTITLSENISVTLKSVFNTDILHPLETSDIDSRSHFSRENEDATKNVLAIKSEILKLGDDEVLESKENYTSIIPIEVVSVENTTESKVNDTYEAVKISFNKYHNAEVLNQYIIYTPLPISVTKSFSLDSSTPGSKGNSEYSKHRVTTSKYFTSTVENKKVALPLRTKKPRHDHNLRDDLSNNREIEINISQNTTLPKTEERFRNEVVTVAKLPCVQKQDISNEKAEWTYLVKDPHKCRPHDAIIGDHDLKEEISKFPEVRLNTFKNNFLPITGKKSVNEMMTERNLQYLPIKDISSATATLPYVVGNSHNTHSPVLGKSISSYELIVELLNLLNHFGSVSKTKEISENIDTLLSYVPIKDIPVVETTTHKIEDSYKNVHTILKESSITQEISEIADNSKIVSNENEPQIEFGSYIPQRISKPVIDLQLSKESPHNEITLGTGKIHLSAEKELSDHIATAGKIYLKNVRLVKSEYIKDIEYANPLKIDMTGKSSPESIEIIKVYTVPKNKLPESAGLTINRDNYEDSVSNGMPWNAHSKPLNMLYLSDMSGEKIPILPDNSKQPGILRFEVNPDVKTLNGFESIFFQHYLNQQMVKTEPIIVKVEEKPYLKYPYLHLLLSSYDTNVNPVLKSSITDLVQNLKKLNDRTEFEISKSDFQVFMMNKVKILFFKIIQKVIPSLREQQVSNNLIFEIIFQCQKLLLPELQQGFTSKCQMDTYKGLVEKIENLVDSY